MTNDHGDILRDLAGVRRRLRTLLALESLGRIVVVVIPSVALTAVLDWWVNFPWLLRAGALAGGILWMALAVWRRVLRPLVAPIPLDQIALRWSAITDVERDEIAGAVEFMDGRGSGSAELWEQLISEASSHGPWQTRRRGLNANRATWSVGSALLLMIATISVSILLPELADVGRSRVFTPWLATEWPRRVRIAPLTGDMTAALGESATPAMSIERGDHPYLRAFIEWGPVGGERRRSPMRRESDGCFRFTFDNVWSPIEYAFVAGDDDTRDRFSRIAVARRPEAEESRLIVQPPDYVGSDAAVVHVLGTEPVTTVRGSRATIEVSPRMAGDSSAPTIGGSVVFDSGDTIELHIAADDSLAEVGEGIQRPILRAAFVVKRGGGFRIRLIDRGGLESQSEVGHELVVKDDEPPTVELLEPAADTEMTLHGALNVVARARDDLGLTALVLSAAVEENKWLTICDLLAEGKSDSPVAAEAVVSVALPVAERSIAWRPRTMEPPLKEGDIVVLAAAAQDGFKRDGLSHDVRRSASRRVRIVSEADLAELLRQSVNVSATRLRGLARDLHASIRESVAVDEGPAVRRAMSDRERDRAAQLSRELRRISEAGAETATQLLDVARRADRNRAARLDVAAQAERLGRSIARLSREQLLDAASTAERASESRRPEEQHAALEESIGAQRQALAEFADFLEALQRWSEFADAGRVIRDLLDRQEELIRQSGALARETLSNSIEELSAAQQNALADLGASQSRLRSESVAAFRGLNELAATLATSDPASATTLIRAAAMAAESAIIENMASASAEIERNRLRGARESQASAADGLRRVLASMEQRIDRELADLSRDVSDLAGAVEKLLRAQEALIEQAHSLPEQSAQPLESPRLADRQRTLAQTAEGVSGRVNGVDHEAMSAKFALLTAAAHMETAGKAFDLGELRAGTQEQENARFQLMDALESLQAMQERIERAMAERAMDAILVALIELRESQSELHRETGTVAARTGSSERLSRVESIRVKALASRQAELAAPLERITERITESIVFRAVCDRIGEHIRIAARQLASGESHAAMTEQSAVLSHLDRLIAVMEIRPEKRNDRFVEAEQGGGGGGAGEPTRSRPVPPLAELRVLKLLQVDLKARTRALAETLPEPLKRSEEQLREIQRIGDEQRSLYELSSRMVDSAKGD
ncbi:MAG: hypothetical protein KF841_04115 [Phycisphaerae bacterium]|nr:hypothetical protein [Phycisphaerae bacterium]